MRRQGGQYMDPNQIQQQQQQQQQYNNYSSYPAPAAGDGYNYVASSRPLDSQHQNQQWNWDPNVSAHPTSGYAEGQANVTSQTALYDPNQQILPNSEPKQQTPPINNTNNKLQTGYQDINNNNAAQTIESLEQKFLQDINKLSKEQNEAEDSEISRHRERLNEISVQFREKLATIRSHHLKQREELAKKEAQIRFQQYNSPNPNPGPAAYSVPYGAELAQQQQRPPAYPVPYSDPVGQQFQPSGGYGGPEVQHRPPYPGPAGQYGYEYSGPRGYSNINNNAGGRQF